jgi:23S rRNA (cytosine1962-C5)-methyltransferase
MAEYRRRHGMTDTEHTEWLSHCVKTVSETLDIPAENVFVKLRQRKPGRQGQYQKLEEKREEFVVEENGLKFIVNLRDYLDTGLFLDHRITRQWVREQSEGKAVLNLFAYTGSFSVYAAAGGAERVVTVDLSNTYLEWAGRNLALNGFTDREKYPLLQADVVQYLKEYHGEVFDIIVLDPPTFSNSQRMKDVLDVQRDHAALINDCLTLLKSGGILYFSTNFSRFVLERDKINSSLIEDVTKKSTPFDFEGKLDRKCFMITRGG